MLLRFGKQNRKDNAGLDEDRDIAADVTEADFIPYAYPYDPHTLITKNGELMQVLRITAGGGGVDYESPEPGMPTLRDAVRRAIGETIDTDVYAYWFHTLRRRVPIQYAPDFPEPLGGDLYKAWQGKHRWQHSYTNELYVSILRQGESSDLLDFKSLKKSLLPLHNRRHREAYTEQAHRELERAVTAIHQKLAAHSNAARLGMAERPDADGQPVMHSELLEFLHYLVNLQAAAVPVADMDISKQLSANELTFGFDAMESRPPQGKRRFAAILTLKGTPELSPEVLDKCLQLPEELIITQSFNYLPKKQALESALEIKEVLDASQDPLIGKIAGIEAALAGDRGGKTDFGEQHASIAVIRDQYRLLDDAIGNVQDSFAALGLVSIREELMLEDCYWAQLPGNFPFLRRRAPVAGRRMGGLLRLNHFPSGQRERAHWGAPLAILPTTLHTPYFFNFHHGEAGHTLLLDFNSFADERGTSLLNFLLACSRQYHGRLFVLDCNHMAKPLMEALGGAYHHPLSAAPNAASCAFNPLQMEDTPRNRAFLTAWLSHFAGARAHEEGTRETLQEALAELFALPPEERGFKRIRRLIATRDAGLLQAPPSLTDIFDAEADTIDFNAALCGIEMLDAMRRKELIVPLVSYLLHRLILTLDGAPTVIVLHEAWNLLDNDFFAPRIASLLEMLQQQNAMVIFTTRHFEGHAESRLTPQLFAHTSTKLFIPDDIAADYLPAATGLTAREVKRLTRMERQKGQFLIKHGPEVVECEFPLEGLEAYAKVLAGDARALRLMQIQQR